MHIGFFVSGWPVSTRASGIVTYTDAIKREIEALGHQVTVFCHDADPECNDPDLHRLGPVQPVGFWEKLRGLMDGDRGADHAIRAFGRSVAREVARVHATKPFDVFEIEESFGWCAELIALNLFPVVVRLHGPTFMVQSHLMGKVASVDRRAEREGKALRGAQFITAPNHCTLDATVQRYGLVDAMVRAIPNPYCLPAAAEVPIDSRPPYPVLLFVGRFDLVKGADLLLQAFQTLARRHGSVRLWFAGPDIGIPDPDGNVLTFQAFVDRFVDPAVRPRIEFLGQQSSEQIRSLRAQATVTLMTSRWENQPYSLMEAMATASPVVAFSTGGIAEMIQHEQNGLAVEPYATDAFASEVERLLMDPELARNIGQAGHDYVSNVHSPQRVALDTLAFYAEAVQGFKGR